MSNLNLANKKANIFIVLYKLIKKTLKILTTCF